MAVLLDVSVLIALFDRDHPMNNAVADWFTDHARSGWATCAITENGFVRIVSNAGYPHPIALGEALATLSQASRHESHEFWACDVTITDPEWLWPGAVLASGQLTDAYLLSLAVKHDGQFLTLDRRISPEIVRGARPGHLITL